ncbi:MAG: hypothetical protein ACK5DV_08855 [Planctomycetota bacterium]
MASHQPEKLVQSLKSRFLHVEPMPTLGPCPIKTEEPRTAE